MSVRNPIRGKRRPVKAGDRFTYAVPDGPPAEAIAAFLGDAQSAVTAGLTLLRLTLNTGVSLSVQGSGQVDPRLRADSDTRITTEVLRQDFM